VTNDDECSIFAIDDKNKNKVFITISNEDKVNVKLIKEYHTFIEKNNITHFILICENITSTVNEILNLMKIRVEVFNTNELQYNILEHSYVPKHEKIEITDEATKKDLVNYPKILFTDPVVRFMGFVVGDVIKITRKNGTIYYRCVVVAN